MKNYSDLLRELTRDDTSVTLELEPHWLQGRTAYGGWQGGLAVSAMRQVVGDEIPLRSFQANFIAPVAPGRVCARAELLRRGKSAAQVEVRIVVDGQVAFTALGIFGTARESVIVERPKAPVTPPVPAVDSLSDLPYIEGMTPIFTRNFQMRWATGKPPFSGAEHANSQIYVRFRGADVLDDAHLVCMADAIPPTAIAMLKAPAMISSMNWTVEFVNAPNEAERRGWFRFDSSLTAAGNGYGWENTAIWSCEGELLALSRQCVALFG